QRILRPLPRAGRYDLLGCVAVCVRHGVRACRGPSRPAPVLHQREEEGARPEGTPDRIRSPAAPQRQGRQAGRGAGPLIALPESQVETARPVTARGPLAIVGGGIVGLATALAAQRARPGRDVTVLG